MSERVGPENPLSGTRSRQVVAELGGEGRTHLGNDAPTKLRQAALELQVGINIHLRLIVGEGFEPILIALPASAAAMLAGSWLGPPDADEMLARIEALHQPAASPDDGSS